MEKDTSVAGDSCTDVFRALLGKYPAMMGFL